MTNPEDQKQDQAHSAGAEDHRELIEEPPVDTPASDSAATEEKAIDSMSVEELRAQVASAMEASESYKDAKLRAEAEMQNVRRRAEREVEHAVKYGSEKLIQSLLPVIDSLEKATEAAEQAGADSEATRAIIEGMGLCQRLFLDVMGKEGVAVVDPHGEPFDPNLHQAISMIENPDVEPNSVVTVVQKGYQLNGRLVRPAMVMVAKGSAPRIDETA